MKIKTLQVKYILALVVLTFSLILWLNTTMTYAVPKATPVMSQTNDGNYYNIGFPPGTIFKGILQTGVSTISNNVGDEFSLIIPADIQIGETVCIPQDSRFIGRIVRLGRAQAGKNGFIQVIIEILRFPDGQEISILAHIWTKNGTGIIGGELTERARYKKMQHSLEGIGEIAQIIPDGPRVMGKETEILPGSEWVVVIDKNLKLLVEKGD